MKKKLKAHSRSQSKSSEITKLSGLARVRGGQPKSQGDIVWVDHWPFVENSLKGERHSALVISPNEFNDNHAWGTLALVTSNFIEPLQVGEYEIRGLQQAGLGGKRSIVAPVVNSMAWSRMEKAGDLSPQEFRQAISKLREAIPL